MYIPQMKTIKKLKFYPLVCNIKKFIYICSMEFLLYL